MNGKPIEAGCRAVVVGRLSGNGTVLKVVDKYCEGVRTPLPDGTSVYTGRNGPLWETDTDLKWVSKNGHAIQMNLCPDKFLRRIDDDWGKTTTWANCKFQSNSIKESA